MLARPHPTQGWLHLRAEDWRVTMQRQIEARDRLGDPAHSGPAPEFLEWVMTQQLPALARSGHYHQQFNDRIAALSLKLDNLERQITGGRLDLEPEAATTRRELEAIAALVETAA